jgi:hypothetical protein
MRREINGSRRRGHGRRARARMYLLGQFALDRRTNARLAGTRPSSSPPASGTTAPRYVRAVERHRGVSAGGRAMPRRAHRGDLGPGPR